MSDAADAVVRVLADVLEVPEGELDRDTELTAYDTWDSMGALEALVQLESQFRLKLNLQNFNEITTVGQLIDLAEAKLATRR